MSIESHGCSGIKDCVICERDVLAADCKTLGGTCTRLAEENARLKEQVGQVALAEYAKGEEVTRLQAEVERLRETLEECCGTGCKRAPAALAPRKGE